MEDEACSEKRRELGIAKQQQQEHIANEYKLPLRTLRRFRFLSFGSSFRERPPLRGEPAFVPTSRPN
jgi:hypothetical protein